MANLKYMTLKKGCSLMALINWLTEPLHYLKRHWSLLTKNWRALSARKDRMKKEQVKEKSHDKEIHTYISKFPL